MKLFQPVVIIIAVVWMGASFIAVAGEPSTNAAKCAVNQPTNADLKLLQGKWEGFQAGDEQLQKITVTVTGNSLHFHRDGDFWFDTAIVLPAGKDPKQLHATIKACPPGQADSIGKVVKAFFKVEQATLVLATIGDGDKETAETFAAAGTRYELRKVQKKDTEPPKAK